MTPTSSRALGTSAEESVAWTSQRHGPKISLCKFKLVCLGLLSLATKGVSTSTEVSRFAELPSDPLRLPSHM